MAIQEKGSPLQTQGNIIMKLIGHEGQPWNALLFQFFLSGVPDPWSPDLSYMLFIGLPALS